MPILCSIDPQLTHFAGQPNRLRIDEELRYDEQRDAAGSCRRIGQAGEDDMHDVLGQIVIAGRNEHLGAGDRGSCHRAAVRPAF
jgi:hypothetical protein